MLDKILGPLIENKELFIKLTIDHIAITLISSAIAAIIGISLGIIISEHRKYSKPVISVINVLYTIPSIALLGILISITGIGNTTAIIALSLYGLMPVVRSTYTGIVTIDKEIIEAAEAMGSSKKQVMRKIKLPLAAPAIFTAVRNMVTMTVALAGIASFVGAGGLGVAIYRGITTNNKGLLITGSVLIALLAIIFDSLLGLIEKLSVGRKAWSLRGSKRNRIAAIIAVILVITVGSVVINNRSDKVINIASKPTTEGYILADIAGELIESKTDLKVKYTQGVGGGTSNIHPAMVKGDFDIYPEYTGTSWQIVLKDKSPYSEDKFSQLKKEYEEKYGLTWTSMFGFNDTYSLAMRRDKADENHIETFSDLKNSGLDKDLTFGAEYDFFEREDGYNGLTSAYGLDFAKVVDMDNGLKYKALLNGKVDVMTVFTTDGQASNPKIKVLKDDKKYYPSYMAGLVVREKVLKEYPEVASLLEKLNGTISEKEMAEMNDQVESKGKKPEEVAREFLKEKKLI